MDNVQDVIIQLKQSREYKSDRHGYVNMPVGKVRFLTPDAVKLPLCKSV